MITVSFKRALCLLDLNMIGDTVKRNKVTVKKSEEVETLSRLILPAFCMGLVPNFYGGVTATDSLRSVSADTR